MMDYELAKKLKDTGFPQLNMRGEGKFFISGSASKVIGKSGEEKFVPQTIDLSRNPEMFVYVPTLSELISALGDINFKIERHKDHYSDRKFTVVSDGIPGEPVETPEVAVAKLWLVLNGSASKASQAEGNN